MTEYLLVTASVLFAWIGLFVATPAALRSMSRHRFWRLRDEIVDAMLAEKLAQPEAAQLLVRRIEAVIRYADHLSPWNLVFLPPAPTHDAQAVQRRMEQFKEVERSLIQSYEHRFFKLVAIHLVTCSPSGWLAGLAMLAAVPLILLRQGWHATCHALYDWMCLLTENRLGAELDRLRMQGGNSVEAFVS